jgi:hypothetical protein
MFAFIRVRFPNTPVSDVWTDSVSNQWMDPNIPFSLAHYWKRTSFFQADMGYKLFPVVSMNDPRPAQPPPGTDIRRNLVDGVTAEITRLFKPNWMEFSHLLIWFAQPTDLFGGGQFSVPTDEGRSQKWIPAAVCDIASPFSSICQEVGHAFGLDHEVDWTGAEYMSPYSSMSSEVYGDQLSSFERPADSRLPVGTAPGPNVTHVVTTDVQRVIGPYITPVQFYSGTLGVFNQPGSLIHVPASYAWTPYSFYLSAVDKAIDTWPRRTPVLAVLPPILENDETFFVELRRNASYDNALSAEVAGQVPPIALVIHSFNTATKRVRYVDRIPLVAAPGDRDYHSFRHHFTVRLQHANKDFSGANITVGGGDFWKHFGVTFENPYEEILSSHIGSWTPIETTPCELFQKATYEYRYTDFTKRITVVASSYGYEAPYYSWYLNDVLLKVPPGTTHSQLPLKLTVKLPKDGKLDTFGEKEIIFQYEIIKNSLRLTVNQPFAGIQAALKVVASETSPGVIKNFYPDRTVWTTIYIDNIKVEWDPAYIRNLVKCWQKRLKEKVHQEKPVFTIPVPEPDPRFNDGVEVHQLLSHLVKVNPAIASIVIDEFAKLRDVTRT